MQKPMVLILLGSNSDKEYIDEATKILDDFGIKYELQITSAHRSPEKTRKIASSAVKNGIEVIIAAAGFAAALPGAVASYTILPVIGVPLPSSNLKGVDSFCSIVQMPKGVPVATMSIGKSGCANAAIFAIQILSLKYHEIRKRLLTYKNKLAS